MQPLAFKNFSSHDHKRFSILILLIKQILLIVLEESTTGEEF